MLIQNGYDEAFLTRHSLNELMEHMYFNKSSGENFHLISESLQPFSMTLQRFVAYAPIRKFDNI